jgi:KaiC/GvpD/RAD55 family RecA-like ATPase
MINDNAMNTTTLNEGSEIPMTYGIKSLDAAIGQYLNPGNIHLFGGFTGSGKTPLACQLTVANTALGKKVLFLSTGVDRPDYFVQCVSNGAQIKYDEFMQFDMCKDSDGNQVPYMPKSDSYDTDTCLRGSLVIQDLIHRAVFSKIEVSKDMAAMITDKIRSSSFIPDVVILDYLSWKHSLTDVHHARKQMILVMKKLRDLSRSMQINIVVFAQLNNKYIGEAHVPVSATCECKTLHEYADISMAMSWLEGPAPMRTGTYSREQYINVQGEHVHAVIPVKTHYDRMALEAGDH